MKMKKNIKTIFSILIALSVVFTSNVVYASELDNTDNSKQTEYVSIGEKLESLLPGKTEEVKEITNIEQLDTKVLNNDSDSAFKSCRLIIYSDKDMEFKDIKGRNNIKKVQKLDKMYIVQYASAKDTEDAYNFYTSLGVEVEIDVVNNTPEGVENKDGENQDVRNEVIASTNETKPTESVDRVKEENKDIVVAVLDSGLNNGDEIFNDKLVEGKNFVDEDSDKTDDVYGHGTTMARVVLDTTNSSNIKIMPIKVLNDEGKGTTLSAYKGIKYAIEKNVDVINLSMSGIGHSKLLESAINEAVNLGIPVVVSAGNDNKEITEYTPANIESAITVSSAYENVLEDGKVEYLKSFYSNYGSDTNNIDFATNGHFEYKRNINDKEVTTKVEGTSVSAAYVTSFITMLKAMALTDEDASNDKLSFNDIYASLSESAIKQEDTKIFGEGFLKKDNFKLVKSEKEEEILPVENVTTDENITLDAQAFNWNSTAATSLYLVVDNTCYVAPHSVTQADFGTAMSLLNQMKRKTGKNFSSVEYVDGRADDQAQPSNAASDKQYDANKMLDKFKWFCNDGQNHKIWFSDTLLVTNTSPIEIKGGTASNPKTITSVEIVNNDANRAPGLEYVNDIGSTQNSNFINIMSGNVTLKDLCLNPSSNFNSSGGPSFTSGNGKRTTLYINTGAKATLDQVSIRTCGKGIGIDNCGTLQLNGGNIVSGGGGTTPSTSAQLINRGTTTQGDFEIGYTQSGVTQCSVYNSGTYTITAGTQSTRRIGYRYETRSVVNIQKPKYGVYNDGTFNVNGGTICGQTGVYNSNSATFKQAGGTIENCDSFGVDNYTANATMSSGTIKGCLVGINNHKTFTLSLGYVESNVIGVQNESGSGITFNQNGSSAYIQSNTTGVANKTNATYNFSNGYIQKNTSYGIKNDGGIVNHSGGSVYHNAGGRVVSGNINEQDTTDAGVYQNGTFNGSAILTTGQNDRTIGRELVTNSSSGDTTKYTLAYGNYNGKTRAKYVKNENGSTNFTGSEVGIH